MMAMPPTSCEFRYDTGGVVTDLCDLHYRSYMAQVEKRMNCSRGTCGD
jgi:hypothetical protein